MAKFKILKYVYDDIEKALSMCESFIELFMKENIYRDHEITCMSTGRYMLVFKLKG